MMYLLLVVKDSSQISCNISHTDICYPQSQKSVTAYLKRKQLLHYFGFALQYTLTRVVVSTAASHARVRGSVPGFPVSAVSKKQKMFLPHPRVKVSIVGSLRDREVACSASDRH